MVFFGNWESDNKIMESFLDKIFIDIIYNGF